MPKFKADIGSKLARLKILIDHIYGQMEQDDRRTNLIRFLNRFPNSEPVGSALSINRWVDGKQFPGAGTRRRLAQALGIGVEVMEKFLLEGSISSEEFLNNLPPVPPEYRRTRLYLPPINVGDPASVAEVISKIANGLSLEDSMAAFVHFETILTRRVRNNREYSEKFLESLLRLLVAYLGPQKDYSFFRPSNLTENSSKTVANFQKPSTKIQKLICEYSDAVRVVFEGVIPDVDSRLAALQLGEKPTEKEIGLLVGALPIGREELMQLYEQEFGSGNHHEGVCHC